MTRADDERTVLELALLTEDRSNAEQLALLRVADRLDFEHNRDTVTNRARRDPQWRPSSLYDYVQSSRAMEDDDKHVDLPKRRGVWPRKGGPVGSPKKNPP